MRLVEQETGRLLGTVDQSSAHGTAHAGAVYLHQGETYLVLSLDLADNVAVVVRRAVVLHLGPELTDIAITDERDHVLWATPR